MLLTTTTPALHIELNKEEEKITYDNTCSFFFHFIYPLVLCAFLVLVLVFSMLIKVHNFFVFVFFLTIEKIRCFNKRRGRCIILILFSCFYNFFGFPLFLFACFFRLVRIEWALNVLRWYMFATYKFFHGSGF